MGRVALATMARSIEGTQTNNGFQLLVSYVGIGLDLDGLLANHLNTTRQWLPEEHWGTTAEAFVRQ